MILSKKARGDSVQDSPTVCGSSHEANEDISLDGKDEVSQYFTLSHRAPTVQRVLDKIRVSDTVKTPIQHSPVFIDANHDALFFPETWKEINPKLIAAISLCAVTVVKEAKKAALKAKLWPAW